MKEFYRKKHFTMRGKSMTRRYLWQECVLLRPYWKSEKVVVPVLQVVS